MEIVKNVCVNEANGKNFVFSPFSMYAALGLLTNGSSGRTLEQLLGFLNSENHNHINSVVSGIIDSLDHKRVNNELGGPIITFIGGVWFQGSDTLKPLFKETANSVYKSEAAAVDFKTMPQAIRHAINKWVEDETNGLIKDLIPDDRSINRGTKLC